jgi:hypothetical protein
MQRGGATALRIAMPPNLAQGRVATWAARGARLEVAGFPAATPMATAHDGTMLATERMLKGAEPPVRELDVGVAGVGPAPPEWGR